MTGIIKLVEKHFKPEITNLNVEFDLPEDKKMTGVLSDMLSLNGLDKQKADEEARWLYENRPVLVDYMKYRLGLDNYYEDLVNRRNRRISDINCGQGYLFQPELYIAKSL